MRTIFFLILAACVPLSGQTIHSGHVRGMRINGTAQAQFPLVLLDAHPVAISFDVDGIHPENFCIKILHCDKDWNVTQSMIINDDFRNYSRNQIPFEHAPFGVKQYQWTYSLRIPGSEDFTRLPQSGNYKVEIWNKDRSVMLAEGKFFAVETIDDSALTIDNRYLSSEISPQNQVNNAVLAFSIPQTQTDKLNPLYSNFITTVDVYRNREIESPHRIDNDHRTVNAYVELVDSRVFKFIIDNLQPGNEYRRIDLSNPDFYPAGEVLRSRNGADLSRWLWQGAADYNGASVEVAGTSDADYVSFQFELDRPEENSNEQIYVVGDFNGWKIDDKWLLKYDGSIKHYKLLAWLRRGAYDYQYVLNGTDWVTLEGNDWRTVNVYTALLYYHDVRFGGFDRILLAAQKQGPGGRETTSR